jgi:hypothetical protein
MGRGGYTRPFRDDASEGADETTVARREWERSLAKLVTQAIKFGKVKFGDDRGFAVEQRDLRTLQARVIRGVRVIERTFWRTAQRRT